MSEYFEWDNAKFSLAIPQIDGEHKILISIMNKFHTRNKDGASRGELTGILSELLSFTATHFTNEENYMESIHYADLKQHKLIHDGILKKLHMHKSEFENSSGKISEDFLDFLKMWLSAHIQVIDRKYTS